MVALPAAAAPRTVSALTAEVPDPVARGVMTGEEYALQQAKLSGQPYELTSARTEATDTWAQPDGSFTVRQYGQAVRVWRDGAWVATDPTLVFAPDGSVVPRASTVAVRFSGGGTGPMLSGAKDGRTLTLSWPKALPKPTLNGNVATYPEVLAGVDLQLKADIEGFSQLLVVKTAEAAKSPELAQLQFATNTVGLDIAKDEETKSLVATDPSGQTVFTSPAPMMWDSSKPANPPTPAAALMAKRALAAGEAASAPADNFEPGAGAKDAPMGTEISGDKLAITPDQKLLTGAGTTYPVYIDPTWGWGDRQKWSWTRVYDRYPSKSYWNANDVVRVGHESDTNGTSRSFFRVDTSYVRGAQIQSATFRLRNVWSWSCQDAPAALYRTEDISPATTWNNQPKQISGALSTSKESKGWSSSQCPAGNLEFDATSALRSSVAANEVSLTLGLYAPNESDVYQWKKFDQKTAVLEVKYNNPPSKPDSLVTSPATSCKAGGTIGNTPISVAAHVYDKDIGNLKAHFQVFKTGTTSAVVDTEIPALNNRYASIVLPGDAVPSGDYTWKVQTRDQDNATSPWSDTCTFTVDRERPSQPPTITSTVFPSGDKGWPDEPNGNVNDDGHFTFGPNGVKDVVAYHWWTDTDPQVNVSQVDTAWTTGASPPNAGPHLVYAFSVDKAGNRSDTASYLYYADRNQARDQPGDLNGDTFKDIWSVDANGTLLTYAGHGNKEFSVATNGGGAFPGQQVTASGDWNEDDKNDLIALERNSESGKNTLRMYPNNGRGVINPQSEDVRTLKVACPKPGVIPPKCRQTPGWTGDDHWSDADQVLSGDFNKDSMPDLLVKQGKQLWVYYGNRTQNLDTVRAHPIPVGGSDWDQFTLVAPGDLNKDGRPDLLMRKNSTGELYRAYGEADPLDPNTVVNYATWGTEGHRTKLDSPLLSQGDYPTLGSSGDFDGDGTADLWGRKTDNTVTGWPGKTVGSDLTGFGQPFTIDGSVGGRRITPGTRLTSGQSITSTSAKLTMQADGNLTITSNANKVLWSTNTSGNPGASALIQSDGNITVNKPGDDSTSLWSTNKVTEGKPEHLSDGFAMLQDRGNLVVYNAKNQSLWSSGTTIRHDYNGDGRSDVADWYNYADGHDALHTLLTNSDGTFKAPFEGAVFPNGYFDATKARFATGDYNGDGRGDVAFLYDYGGGKVKLFTALSKPDGTYQTPLIESWSSPSGWWASDLKLESGDFNGDGRDDIAAWYSYADGSDRLFTFTADIRGGFNPPFDSYYLKAGNWDVTKSKFVTGDFNGDGRDDIAALYCYPDGSVKMHTFAATPTGAFEPSIQSWGDTATGWGDWNRTSIQAGDFNGDGIDDVVAWYDYADGHDGLHTMIASGSHTGEFAKPIPALTMPAGWWDVNQSKLIAGDFDGDGRDDLASLYSYGNGSVRMFTFTAKTDNSGTFNAGVSSWSTPSGWNINEANVIRPYN
ncbi:FG-GAP-like repeat-containing protein [Streptomyces sp. NPDC006692]|uniref:FG-GAP-like repeat-containing protein n=1 Tax=Streptomyces sp. NPDC006692 TaxID=3364758 RepID=UPI003691A1BF